MLAQHQLWAPTKPSQPARKTDVIARAVYMYVLYTFLHVPNIHYHCVQHLLHICQHPHLSIRTFLSFAGSRLLSFSIVWIARTSFKPHTSTVTFAMSSSDLDMLVEMGFEKNKAAFAVKKGGNRTSSPLLYTFHHLIRYCQSRVPLTG